MNDQLLARLHEMKLSGMAEAYKEQAQSKAYKEMSFEDRFALIVDLEHARRKSNTLNRYIQAASFSDTKACIEDIEYHEDRHLNKALILKLASGQYIQEHHNLILKGPTGSGKTFMACAFGVSACRQYHKVKYVRLPELLDELALAKLAADGSYCVLQNESAEYCSLTWRCNFTWRGEYDSLPWAKPALDIAGFTA